MAELKPLAVTYKRCYELLEICKPSDFEKESGLKNKVNRGTKAKAGDWAGYLRNKVTKSGKIRKEWMVTIDYKNYLASRIIYFMEHGKDPYPLEIDHNNQDSRDNRVENLRLAEEDGIQSQNRGTPKNNTSGVKGVSRDKNKGKWMAYIKVNDKQIHLGYFNTVKEAAASRNEAVLKYFSEKTRELNLVDLETITN